MEMNYMIEGLSSQLVISLMNAVSLMKTATDADSLVIILGIENSILHIFESILSQEELPDFYEENLPKISEACVEILKFTSPLLDNEKKLESLHKARGKVVRLVHLY
jgi:hypothetical protein